MFDWLIVGAGFAGSVLAERLASQRNERVMIIDRRPHIGGNAYDHLDAAGLLIHRYGPHIFHTNAQQVADYLSRFTSWRPYEHRVLAEVKRPGSGETLRVPIPINLDTINRLYGLSLTEAEVEAWMAARAEPVAEIRTSEDVVVGKVGRELYELFFRGYTRKQWALDPSELDRSVTARVPTRTNRDDRYFTDSFQAMPAEGYTKMFERMLAHPNITIRTGVDYRAIRDQVPHRKLIWTGPVDEYFGFRFGKLPYRSLRFEHQTLDQEWHQPVGTVNYPAEDVPYTRTSEYKHLTGQVHPRTSITTEYPSAEGDPYYPIPRPENQVLYKRYEALADATQDVWFVGRLATYRYYNMDQIVGQALATFQRIAAGVPRASAVVAAE
ncbi:UDP-galactopyranose mutase [Siccirubricoccus deserti]|uniref:UDP-galactopyranose mutase n=1 Tax=Siccirubricoccus deserti TaxID=2013562 RepID=A0A9X0UCJ2_9PROT|nr:UDP-galactopyranose mutase [Siccirubricoccus deserti]MBC4014458.1 UDP-galactopyranose mutase [Siccirubricoccus deserti]GGC32720.1 UDP-galactopyranose mutase [Siccirubricoccus deserti]